MHTARPTTPRPLATGGALLALAMVACHSGTRAGATGDGALARPAETPVPAAPDPVPAAPDGPAPAEPEPVAPAGPPDPAAEQAAAAACIERLGGRRESSRDVLRPGVESRRSSERAVVRADATPGGPRLLLGTGALAVAVDRAAVLRGLDEPPGGWPDDGSEAFVARLRAAGPGDLRIDEPRDGAPATPLAAGMRVASTAADEIEAGRFELVGPDGSPAGSTLVRERESSQLGGRSGAGGRTFRAPDCTVLLRVVDWVS